MIKDRQAKRRHVAKVKSHALKIKIKINDHFFHWSNDTKFTETSKALIEYGAIMKHEIDKNITYSIPEPDLEVLKPDNEHFAAMRNDVFDLLMVGCNPLNDLKLRSKLNHRKRSNYANRQAFNFLNEMRDLSTDFDPNKEKGKLQRITQSTIANCSGGYEMISDLIGLESHSQQCLDLTTAKKSTCHENNSDGIECNEYNCEHGVSGCNNRKYLKPHLTSCYPRKSYVIDGFELIAFEDIMGQVYIGQYVGSGIGG